SSSSHLLALPTLQTQPPSPAPPPLPDALPISGPSATTIDATGTGRAAVILAARTSGRVKTDFSIEGFTITGGIGENRSGVSRVSGGGVFVLGNAVVSNNVITGNIMSGPQPNWIGGGVYVGYGDPVIIGNTIT